MRYITRELYESLQDALSFPLEEAKQVGRLWQETCLAYQAELSKIEPNLPPGMRAFAKVTLHDGVVKYASETGPGEVELHVDATGNPWGPVGWFRVRFHGVREVEGLAEVIDDEWLYEEVHLHPLAGFEYCILLWRHHFRIVADEVTFEPLT